MVEYYEAQQGEVRIEYRHGDGSKVCNLQGLPLINYSRIKDPRILEELVDMFKLEPFLVVR